MPHIRCTVDNCQHKGPVESMISGSAVERFYVTDRDIIQASRITATHHRWLTFFLNE
jgi:hypothetical protein